MWKMTTNRRTKRLKANETKRVYVIFGSHRKTIKQQKIHKLLRICEKPIAQKLLNAAKLFQGRVYIMKRLRCAVLKMFLQQIFTTTALQLTTLYKYNLQIDEIMKSLDAKESMAAGNKLMKKRFRH